MVKVKNIHFSLDGTVLIELSDNKKFKLTSQFWIELRHPREDPLSESLIEQIEIESNYTKIREKILSLLALREHSEFELKSKIRQSLKKFRIKDFSLIFNRCILEMQDKDLQSDERFTRQFVKSRIGKKFQGPFKILQDLYNRGIHPELAKAVLEEIADHELWIKKTINYMEYSYKKNNNILETSFCQKLYQKGFSWEMINQALEQFKNNTEDFKGFDN